MFSPICYILIMTPVNKYHLSERVVEELCDRVTPVRAILFDKDGTLFDFRRTWVPIIREATRRVSAGDEDLAERLVRAAGYDPRTDTFVPDGPLAAGNVGDIACAWTSLLPGHRTEKLVDEMNRFSADQGPRYSVPVCDLSPLMERLTTAGYRLGLATSDSEEGARLTLARFGVESSFSWVSGYDSGYGVKPDPVVIENYARAIGLRTDQVMMVGDTFHDLRMGREAGAAIVVAVLTGAVSAEVLAPEADVILPSIADLPKLLRVPD